jgi:hypothetical protein
MNRQAQQISNLTKKQNELFLSLVRLGDSIELALSTVLDERFNPEIKKDNSMYENAYYN